MWDSGKVTFFSWNLTSSYSRKGGYCWPSSHNHYVITIPFHSPTQRFQSCMLSVDYTVFPPPLTILLSQQPRARGRHQNYHQNFSMCALISSLCSCYSSRGFFSSLNRWISLRTYTHHHCLLQTTLAAFQRFCMVWDCFAMLTHSLQLIFTRHGPCFIWESMIFFLF